MLDSVSLFGIRGHNALESNQASRMKMALMMGHIHTSKFHPSSEVCQQMGCVCACGIRGHNALESNRALQMKRALMMGHIHTSRSYLPVRLVIRRVAFLFVAFVVATLWSPIGLRVGRGS